MTRAIRLRWKIALLVLARSLAVSLVDEQDLPARDRIEYARRVRQLGQWRGRLERLRAV